MLSRVEKKQPMKHKPKRKVSELDETAARRRRNQTCLAQRAFRKRNKDITASLYTQNADLHKTVENLNACFLTFTDDLIASAWLERDPHITKSLQRTIEYFIAVVRASRIIREDNSTAHDDGNSGSAAMESHAPKSTQDDPSSVVKESTTTISNTGINSSTMMIQDLHTTFIRPHNTEASEHKKIAVQCVRNNAISADCHEIWSTHNDTLNYKPQLQRSINLCKITFAQKLQIEAIRAGLRLISNAEDSSQLFYQVFNRVLDLPTRESYRVLLSRTLDENLNQSLQPPPASSLDKSWPGSESCVWLNASGVTNYFRSIGMDFDSSLEIITGEINPRCLPYIWAHMQDPPETRLVTRSGDGFAKSQHQQPPHGMACLSGAACHDCTGTGQDANEFEMYALDPSYSTRGYGRSYVSVDVSRLIDEIIQGTRCYYQNPTFNQNELKVALARAVVQTH